MKVLVMDLEHKPTYEVEAIETSNPNLCIHPCLYKEGMPFEIYGESWTVTHIPSGAAVFSRLPGQKIAQAAAGWLTAQALDWNLGFEEILKAAPEDFKLSVYRIRGSVEDCVSSTLYLMDEFGLLPKETA
jgi:hypothetical protein